MTGLILFVWRYSSPENRNLLRVRELLTQGLRDDDYSDSDSFDFLLDAMKMTDDFGGIIAEAAASMRGSSSDKNYPRESAIDQTSWISIPQVAKTLRNSDFLCRDLKISDTSVFIAAPVTDIQGKLSGWVRALTMMTMEAFQKTQGQPKNVCLFAIDEMPSLGRIPVLVDASAVFRKYKVRLITVTQDIEKLKAAYPNEWGGFLGNSECVVWMATNNHETKEYLSQLLGKATIKEHEERKWMLSRKKIKVMRHDRDLMTAEQIGRFLSSNIIVTRYGNRPLKLKHAPYYTDLPVFYYEADPKFGENPRRAYTRKLLNEKLLKSARFRKFIR
jgi:type IV secretion system protein VirD4